MPLKIVICDAVLQGIEMVRRGNKMIEMCSGKVCNLNAGTILLVIKKNVLSYRFADNYIRYDRVFVHGKVGLLLQDAADVLE